jgi:hypothetical protein
MRVLFLRDCARIFLVCGLDVEDGESGLCEVRVIFIGVGLKSECIDKDQVHSMKCNNRLEILPVLCVLTGEIKALSVSVLCVAEV